MNIAKMKRSIGDYLKLLEDVGVDISKVKEV